MGLYVEPDDIALLSNDTLMDQYYQLGTLLDEKKNNTFSEEACLILDDIQCIYENEIDRRIDNGMLVFM
jgi:hypothetical protein